MKRWLICAGPDWHRPSVTSTKQLANRFHADGYRVLWVNPVAFKSPFVNSANRASAWKKIGNKLRTHLRFLTRPRPGFWVWVPVYFPGFSPRAEQINRWLIRMQFGLLRAVLGVNLRNSILWMSGGFTGLAFSGLPFRGRVYQAADLISEFRGASSDLKLRLEEKERELCRVAQLRLAASETIAGKLQALGGHPVHVLHHGVDFEHFSTDCPLDSRIAGIRAAGRPVAGYYGSLSDANDQDAFLALADAGFSVVLGGKELGDYSRLKKHPHIHFLGPVPYSILPSVARGFDVALLNWRPHAWIENCFPVKALEYLACGLPVVGTRIPVLEKHFPEEIAFVEGPQAYVTACRVAVDSDSNPARARRRERVREWTWQARYETVKVLLGNVAI